MVSAVQGIYYFVTGLWPIVYMTGFLAFTGPKVDLWLVRTVGWLLIVSGIVLMVAAARRRQRSAEVALLAVGNAAVLASADTYFAATGQIPGVYLLDAAVEVGFLLWWIRTIWTSRRSLHGRSSVES
jgi:uncharacterized membrane protein HdeD (DUF308 family)